jgi:broad specificity phosphatase PhoE
MPTRVWLFRHAETATPHLFHGAESDVGLSDRGLNQIQILLPHIIAARPDRVASSAMRRALATAEPIALACELPLIVEPNLHERRVGSLSGKPHADPESPWPETVRRWIAGDTAYAPPGMESFDMIRDRVVPIWQRLTERHRGEFLVVVAHGIVIRVLLLSLLPNRSSADWDALGRVRNLSLSELIEEQGQWRAARVAEMLPGLE